MSRTDKRTLREQRGIVNTAIGDAIAADVYLPLTPTVQQRPYRPIETVGVDASSKALIGHPRITVTGIAFDEMTLTRVTKQRLMMLRIFVEAVVEPTDYDAVDSLSVCLWIHEQPKHELGVEILSYP